MKPTCHANSSRLAAARAESGRQRNYMYLIKVYKTLSQTLYYNSPLASGTRPKCLKKMYKVTTWDPTLEMEKN